MKLHIDEQVLTAYALDELPIQQRIEVKAYLATHPDAAAEVEAIRAMAGQLTAELAAEAATFGSITKPVVAESPMKIRRSRRVEAMLALAASVALVGGAAVVMIRSAAERSANQPLAVLTQPLSTESGQFAPTTQPQLNATPSTSIAPTKTQWISSFPVESGVGKTSGAGRTKDELEISGKWVNQAVSPSPSDSVLASPAHPAIVSAGVGGDPSRSRVYDVDDLSALVAKLPAPKKFDLDGQPSASSQMETFNPVGSGALTSEGGGSALLAPNAPNARFGTGAGTVVASKGTEGLGRRTSANARSDASEYKHYVVPGPNGQAALGDPASLNIADREHNTEAYDRIVDNAFLSAEQNPLSTFSIDVDTASYSNLRRFLTQGQLPPKDAVRIEEMVNYFPYRYDGPKDGDKPFAASVEVAGCPWSPGHRLVRVAIKGKEIAPKDRPASNLVFLIDVSGSMNEPNKLPLVKESLRKLVNKLDARDRVAMVVYAGNSGLVLPSTDIGSGELDELHVQYQDLKREIVAKKADNRVIDADLERLRMLGEKMGKSFHEMSKNRESVLTAIDRLEAGGSTNGGAGIELAYLTAQSAFIKGGVNRVILCTDGDFNVGVTDQGDLTRLIEDKAKGGTFLSVLGFGMGNTKDSTMEKLADKGNGNYAYIDTAKEAQKVLVEQMSGTLVTIAKDVKIQVEFNPAKVGSYRLIGYENRILAKEDFNNDLKDAGEIGAGHTVTALYEVAPFSELTFRPAVDPLKYQKPAADVQKAASNDLLTLKIRYKAPDAPLEQGTSKLQEFPITDDGKGYEKASEDFKFAAAVASFGMILRNSEYKGTSSYDAAIEMAMEGKGLDANGYRAELIELIKKAKAISNQ